jgi:D-glycero-D-manno-heptose 1,7-bisphosphate phosphatase
MSTKALNKAIFLDRDGVLNHDPGDYTKSVSEFSILPDVPQVLKAWQDKGYKLIVITNQAGIAKGLYTHEDVHEIHDFLRAELAKFNVQLTDIFYSPYHENYSKSLSRKPGSLMIERALHLYNIDVSSSYMIGDKERDLEAARGAGVERGILIETNQAITSIIDRIA